MHTLTSPSNSPGSSEPSQFISTPGSKWINEIMSLRPTLELKPEQAERLYNLDKDYTNGVNIILQAGTFTINKVIKIPPNTTIQGQGVDKTILVLVPKSNCHMFENAQINGVSKNIWVEGLSVEGTGDSQQREAHHKALTFCCAFYFKKIESVVLQDIVFHDIRQTAIHFNTVVNASIRRVKADKLGWSGVSSSNASNVWVECEVSDAGRDIMHSGIHMDGGTGIYVDALVTATTGNGIMIESSFAPVRNCVVRGRVFGCKRGVSLSGLYTQPIENVVLEGDFSSNRETGIMISNATSVVIVNSAICNNLTYGVHLQGRVGGNNVNIVGSRIENNGTDVAEFHGSSGNWNFIDPMVTPGPSAVVPNLKTLEKFTKTAPAWFTL